MKNFRHFLFVISALVFVSCSTYEYSFRLVDVERPVDAKQQFGETESVVVKNNGLCRYEDEYIDVTWHVDMESIRFSITNKTNHSLKINWNDVCFVDANNQVRHVTHSGYKDLNNLQPMSMIPNGSTLTDCIIPEVRVYNYNHIGKKKTYILPNIYKQYKDTKELESTKQSATSFVGKKITLVVPIIIKNVQNDYMFTFVVDRLLNTQSR